MNRLDIPVYVHASKKWIVALVIVKLNEIAVASSLNCAIIIKRNVNVLTFHIMYLPSVVFGQFMSFGHFFQFSATYLK